MMQPDPKNRLSWSTAGSVEKNLPHLVKAHTEVIEEHRPSAILEIASGFGDHILAYAREYPNISFQPTEYDNYLVAELTTKVQSAGLSNVQSPMKVDVSNKYDWQSLRESANKPFDIITVTNLVNVAPWSVTEELFNAIGTLEPPILRRDGGVVCLYAALKKGGAFQSEADEKFDQALKARAPEFGLRDFHDIVNLAEKQGMKLISDEALGGGTNLFLQFRFRTTL